MRQKHRRNRVPMVRHPAAHQGYRRSRHAPSRSGLARQHPERRLSTTLPFHHPFSRKNRARWTIIGDMRVLGSEGNRSLALLPAFSQARFSKRKLVFRHSSHIGDLCPRRGSLYVKPPLTWVPHRRPSRKAGSPYHGIGRGAVRRRSRERHRIAVRHADPCGEEGARRRAQGGHRRGARLPSLRPGRPVALPEVRQPLLRAQGPGPRRRAAVAVPRLRQDVLRAHARPARIVEAARVGVDVLRRVHGRRAPPAGDGCPRRGLPLHGVVHAHAGLRGHGAAHPGLPAGDLPRRRHPGGAA